MKRFIPMIFLLLPSCAILETNFPKQADRMVELSRKGIAQYCARTPLDARQDIRTRLNTPEQGAVVYCTSDERMEALKE